MDDPADIWSIDGSLNTLSDRPGMDSQNTNSFGIKFSKNYSNFDLQSFTSTTKTDVIFSYDADWGNADSHFPYIYDYFSKTLRKRETFGQEIRILSKNGDFSQKNRLDWLFGVDFSQLEESNATKDDGIYGDPSDPYGPYISETIVSRDYDAKNLSIFGNIDYLLADNYKLTFGLRWENWNSKYKDSNNEAFDPSDNMNGGKISIIKNNKNSNIYFSVARGYKQGGFNIGLDAADNLIKESLIYNPEFLTNYEAGISSNITNSNLNYSATIFFSRREDQQVLISRQVNINDPNTFSYLIQNAAEGENYGLEISSNYLVTDNLYLFANVGILKSKIKNWESRIDLENRSQAHAPEQTYSIGAYADLKNNISIKIDINGKSSFYYSDSHENKSKRYQLVNLAFEKSWGDLSADIWIRNLFDEYYSTRGFFFGNEAPDFINTLYRRQGDPRNYGLSIRYDF